MGVTYLDFDLLVERSGDGYRSRVIQSPGGQASATFSAPFSAMEIENLVLKVSRSVGKRDVRRIESSELRNVQAFGARLYDTVFDGDVRACLRSSLDEASRQDAGLRIRLRLGDVPELIDLPWEYMYNQSLNRFIARQLETPVVRYMDLAESIRPLTVHPPVRVLVMVSSPSDYPPLDVEHEWTKLHEALADLEQRGLVLLDRLDEATLPALQRRLRHGPYHVFHFVGHGGFDEGMDDGVLVLEGQDGRGHLVSGSYLGEMLRGEQPVRLALLNACEGARNGTTDPFSGAAQSMVQQGISAVIAMQFEISDAAAIVLAQEFYAALADGYPVDAALGEARRAIFSQGNELEWATPVLYMRSPDGRIFDIARTEEPPGHLEAEEGTVESPPIHVEPGVPKLPPIHVEPDVPALITVHAEGDDGRARRRWVPYVVGAAIVAFGVVVFLALRDTGGSGPTIAISGPRVTQDAGTLQLASNVSDAVFHCQVDGGAERTCPSEAPFTGLSDGSHVLTAWAVAPDGNVGEPSTFTWTVDTKPPTVAFTDPPVQTSQTARFVYTVDDPDAVVTCTLDSEFLECDPTSVTVRNLDFGQHIIRVRATDLAGNTVQVQAKWTVGSSNSGEVPTNTVAPSFSCDEPGHCTATPGSWNGDPTGYAYVWQDHCDSSGDGCILQAGMTEPTASGLCGYARVLVTAENGVGWSAAAPSELGSADLMGC